MKQTAVEWLQEALSIHFTFEQQMQFEGLFQQAKEMEKKKKLINQLFIGKVSEIIGFEKTIQLLKEAKETYKIE